jgi:5-formyltetrahydrofolate cyclo-ligase
MNAIKCGFAFKEQVVELVPTTVTDVPMDVLVTDHEVIGFV